MDVLIKILLIIILLMGIIVLGKYTYIQLNRPKIKLPSFWGHGFFYQFAYVLVIALAIIVVIIIIVAIGSCIYDQPQPGPYELPRR